MAKFYVQCGPIQLVIQSQTRNEAALFAINTMLDNHLWIYDDPGLSEVECRDHLMLEALCHLDPVIRVSERGFRSDDCLEIGTPETIDRWHRLVIGTRRLFNAVGLPPRAIVPTAAVEELGDVSSFVRRTRSRLPR